MPAGAAMGSELPTLGLLAAAMSIQPAAALAAPQVVVSIKPIHSLVASIMKGIAEPELILKGAGSPHTYQLKPADAEMLQNADLVFWVGPELEKFLEKPIDSLSSDAKVVELEDAPGLEKLPMREGGAFEPHDDGDEGEAVVQHGHGLCRAEQPARVPRLDPLLAGDQRDAVRALDRADAVIDLPRK